MITSVSMFLSRFWLMALKTDSSCVVLERFRKKPCWRGLMNCLTWLFMKFNTDTTFQVFPINNTQQGNRPIIFSLLRRVFYMHWCDIVLFFSFSGDASSSEGEIKPSQRLGIICLLHVLVKCRMSSICITSVCCCERTKIAKVKTDEK